MGTLATTLYEVRRLIGDRRPGDPVCVDPFLEELVDIAIEELRDEIGMGLVKTTGFQLLSAGVSTYTLALPTHIVSIAAMQDLVLESSGYPLDKKTMAFILSMRVNNADAKGQPRFYAIVEGMVSPLNSTRKVTLELYPPPVADDAVTAYWEPVYERTEESGTNTTTIMPFSKAGLTVLRMRVGGKAVMALADDALGRLNPPKSRAFGTDLLNQSAALAAAEFWRLHSGAVPDSVERTR